MAISFDLKAHDATFHHGNFDEQAYKAGKVTCKFRDRIHDYENVDDLSQAQNITDALEDAELLDEMMAAALDDETKKGLAEKIKGTEDILAKILGRKTSGAGGNSSSSGVAAITQFGPNEPLGHDKKAFPDKNDAKWQDALAHYGDSSYGWKSVGSGSTNPHKITFNGKTYFVKQAGNNPTYDKAAARNEANANNFLRLAGLNAPDSMYLKANDGNRFCITTEADLSGGHLDAKLGDKRIAEQVKAAYPIMSLLYNMDIMQNSDNAFIDKNGTPMFLDNGSTFGFSAQGVRNKRFDFDAREDPENDSPNFTALANFKGNTSGENWRKAIMGSSSKDVDMETALREAAKYEMGALVREADKQGMLKQLPKNGKDSLVAYADALDKLSAKYKSKASPASAPTSLTQAGGAGGGGSSSGTIKQQQQSSSTSVSQNQQATQKPQTQPTASTITPAQQKQVQQVQAMPAPQRTKAIGRLQRMLAMPNLSAGQKATYQAMINLMNGKPANYQAPVNAATPASGSGVSAPEGVTASSTPAASSSGSGIPANIPNTPAAQRLLKMINDPKTSATMKQNYIKMLNKIVSAASSK